MARSLWTGFVSFGLVSVPVGMYRATEDQTVHFNQLNKNTGHRIRYKKVDEVSGEEVPATEIVNGHDMGDGEYVIVTKDELKEAAPGKSELMEISDFVDLAAIDPIYFRQSYYLAPRGKGADRAYALLRQAMQETNKIGIATLGPARQGAPRRDPARPTTSSSSRRCSSRTRSEQPSEELDTLPKNAKFEGRELTVAKTLVESLTVDWEPDRYHNTYRGRVEELIEAKRKGKSVVAKTEKPKTNVVDLMSALEASVARTGKTPDKAANGSGSKAKSRRHGKAASPAPLEKLSKAKLSALAAEFDIAGRSSMSKDDLVSALNDAGATAPTTRRRLPRSRALASRFECRPRHRVCQAQSPVPSPQQPISAGSVSEGVGSAASSSPTGWFAAGGSVSELFDDVGCSVIAVPPWRIDSAEHPYGSADANLPAQGGLHAWIYRFAVGRR